MSEHYLYRVTTSTMWEKEFYLHPSSEWHFYEKLRGRRLAEPLQPHTELSPFQSALYKIQASVQTEMREQDEHNVSLLCIFSEDDPKYCFFKLLTSYLIIHIHNRSLNALLVQNFWMSNTEWEHPALNAMDTSQRATKDKLGLPTGSWVKHLVFALLKKQQQKEIATTEEPAECSQGHRASFLLKWNIFQPEATRRFKSICMCKSFKNWQPFVFQCSVPKRTNLSCIWNEILPFPPSWRSDKICCLYHEATKANFSAQEQPGRQILRTTKTPTELAQALTTDYSEVFHCSKSFGSFSHLEICA